MTYIEITDLCHCFADGAETLSNINLTIEKGEFIVLAGPNGSGKTTFFRHLNGLLLPEKGEVTIDGAPIRKNLTQVRQQVGMVFQDADMQIVGETVYDDVVFGPENLGLDREEIDCRATEALTAVGLLAQKDRPPHHLSQGEKRRLAVAGVLAMHSEVILFDEPFSNLDDRGVCQVLEQMVKLHQNGHTLIIATHDLEKVIYHADRLVLINGGRIVADGPPATILPKVEQYGVRMPCALRMGGDVASWLTH